MKKVFKEIYPYAVIVIVVVLFRTFIATPIRVDGQSMYDTLNNGDILILNKIHGKLNRFDIVVVNYKNSKLIKRVIGLPGESIKYKENILYIDNKEVEDVTNIRTGDFSIEELYGIDKIPEGYYFVMGDNRTNSSDSRDTRIGLIKRSDIIGTSRFRIYPFNKIGKFN